MRHEPGPQAADFQISLCYCKRPGRRADASLTQSCMSRPGPLCGCWSSTSLLPPLCRSGCVSVCWSWCVLQKKTHLASGANLSQAVEDPITVVMNVTTNCQQPHTQHWPHNQEEMCVLIFPPGCVCVWVDGFREKAALLHHLILSVFERDRELICFDYSCDCVNTL